MFKIADCSSCPFLAVILGSLAGLFGCAVRPPAPVAATGQQTKPVHASDKPAGRIPGAAAKADVSNQPAVTVQRCAAKLPAGRVVFDLYLPPLRDAAPLVVVAHGFWRNRKNMAGWGRRLAQEGFLAAVPDLPAWSDHARNGKAINELITWVLAHPPATVPINDESIAVMGFSAGGLATLLAAADNPKIRLWVGLDPVDRGRLGVTAAARLKAGAAIIKAEPSRCNAHSNADPIARALDGRVAVILVPGATHPDAEWPTDWKARLVCGGSSEARRALFAEHAMRALSALK